MPMESSSPLDSKLTDTTFMGCPAAALEPNFHVDDLLDFPNEDDDTDGTEATFGSSLIPHATAAGGGQLFSAPPLSAASIQANKEEAALHEELSHGLCVPPDDLFHQLEWLSSFNEDNFFSGGDTKLFSAMTSSARASAGLTRTCKDIPPTIHRARDNFRSESPVSVLEHGGQAYALNHHVQRVSRIRKARTGGRVWSLDILKPVLFRNRVKASYDNNSLLVTSYSSAYSEPLCSFLQAEEFERPHKKMKVGANDATIDFALVQKCTHCLVQKTPQWRAGPMGPKTLCNACGVRYKSGRLVPEYRPAASPSFVSEVHSNSHRRILEMRRVKYVESSVNHYKSKTQVAFKRPDSKRESWIPPCVSDKHTCTETQSSKENGLSYVGISACEEAKGGVRNKGLCSKGDSCDVRTVLCEANIAFDQADLHKAPSSTLACKEKRTQEIACISNMRAVCEGDSLCGKGTSADMDGLDTHPSSHKVEPRVQNDEEIVTQ